MFFVDFLWIVYGRFIDVYIFVGFGRSFYRMYRGNMVLGNGWVDGVIFYFKFLRRFYGFEDVFYV